MLAFEAKKIAILKLDPGLIPQGFSEPPHGNLVCRRDSDDPRIRFIRFQPQIGYVEDDALRPLRLEHGTVDSTKQSIRPRELQMPGFDAEWNGNPEVGKTR